MKMETESGIKTAIICLTLSIQQTGMSRKRWNTGGSSGRLPLIQKFEEKGLDVRIDHRSYVRQGLDLIPTVHEGANVRQMEAKGIRTEKGELNRWIKATNRLMQDVRKKIKALFVWMAEVKEELSKPQTPSLADLLIAYYNQRNAGAWSNKARTGNLKQFAEAVNYLTENKLLTLEDLQERLSSVNEEFEALSDSMKKKSARIKELQELIREGENYQRLKPVHTELNNIKFKKQREKFETSHDAELRLFYAARRILKEKLDGKPIALKAWKQEYAQLKTEYAELSPQHKPRPGGSHTATAGAERRRYRTAPEGAATGSTEKET